MDDESDHSRAQSHTDGARSEGVPDGDSEKVENVDEANASGDDENSREDAEIDDEELFGDANDDLPQVFLAKLWIGGLLTLKGTGNVARSMTRNLTLEMTKIERIG